MWSSKFGSVGWCLLWRHKFLFVLYILCCRGILSALDTADPSMNDSHQIIKEDGLLSSEKYAVAMHRANIRIISSTYTHNFPGRVIFKLHFEWCVKPGTLSQPHAFRISVGFYLFVYLLLELLQTNGIIWFYLKFSFLGTNIKSPILHWTGSRWRVKQLTYSITKYPSALKSADVDRELAKAFQVWEDVTELTFVHLRTGKVHIEIRYDDDISSFLFFCVPWLFSQQLCSAF